MKSRLLVYAALALSLVLAGCALFQTPTDATAAQQQQQTVAQQSQAITASITAADALLTEIKAAKTVSPTTAPSTSSTTSTPATAPASSDTLDKTTQALQLITTAAQNLNTQIQNAPTVQAQQQAAINTAVQTAQGAAVTFGGQYGTLIAAGIGIVSVLVQGLFHSKAQATQTASANATATALAGHLVSLTAGMPVNSPANVSAAPVTH